MADYGESENLEIWVYGEKVRKWFDILIQLVRKWKVVRIELRKTRIELCTKMYEIRQVCECLVVNGDKLGKFSKIRKYNKLE